MFATAHEALHRGDICVGVLNGMDIIDIGHHQCRIKNGFIS